MTTIARSNARSMWDDFYAEVTVILLVLVAAAAGWLLKSGVEGRAVPVEAAGITAQAPAGWLRDTRSRGEVLRVTNPASDGFATSYALETQPVPAGSTPAQVASLLTLQRAQALTAYRVLDQQDVTVNGQPAHMLTFAYVEPNPDVTRSELPQVVRGVEFIFVPGERAVLVSYHAGEDNYEADFGRFRQFLNSVAY